MRLIYLFEDKKNDQQSIMSAIDDVGYARTAKFDINWEDESRRQPSSGEPNSISTSEESGTICGNKPIKKRRYNARRFNAYDEQGQLVGTMSIIVDGYAPGAFKIAVRPDAQRRGYGSKLLSAAEASGINMLEAMRCNSFSSSGRNLASRWLKQKLSPDTK